MKSNISKFITGSLAAVFMLFASQSATQAQVTNQNQNQNSQDQTVVEVLQNSNEHTIFLSLLEESGKLQELRDAQNVTVIAPTDRAFENMDKDVNELRQDRQKLDEFLSNHIKENGMDTGINNQQDNERTRQDNSQNRSATGQDKQVIQASNGEVHVVQEVKKADMNKENKQHENQDEDWK